MDMDMDMDSNTSDQSNKPNKSIEKRKQFLSMKKLEKRLSIFAISNARKICSRPRKISCYSKSLFKNQIAENITSVVGLKEAITFQHKALRIVWAISLFVGIGFTGYFVFAAFKEYLSDPTATKVDLIPQETYEYPPIILCTEAWLDVPKALSLGLSLDALKYSLGYYDIYNKFLLENDITNAKQDFFQFYHQNNFTSLEEYYQKIASDVWAVDSKRDFLFSFNSTSFCPNCESPMEKLFHGQGICYLYRLASVTGDLSGKSKLDQSVSIYIKISDSTRNLVQVTNIWQVYITQSFNLPLKFLAETKVRLQKFTINYLRITPERVVKLNSCKNRKNYLSEICYFECLNQIYERNYSCLSFANSIAKSDTNIDPERFCNIFDLVNLTNHIDKVNKMKEQNYATAELSQKIRCSKKCPKQCDQFVYDIFIRWQIDEENFLSDWTKMTKEAKKLNMSFLGLKIGHQSLRQGGIFTMKEVSTISFTTLVSNLGGALGLFVGGTMMTFVQVILFVIKYFLNRRNRK